MEYDLANSTATTGLLCVKTTRTDGTPALSQRLEQSAKPTAVLWHPRLQGDDEDRWVGGPRLSLTVL